MSTPMYHKGEHIAQSLAGTRGVADELGGMVSTSLHVGSRFDSLLSSLRLLTVSSVTPASANRPHSVWVSVLFGDSFVSSAGPQTLLVDESAVPPQDILRNNLKSSTNSPVGIVVVDFLNRRRYRTNGTVQHWPSFAKPSGKAVVSINVKEAFGNCPKYIQVRDVTQETSRMPAIAEGATFEADDKLSRADKDIIQKADTFFLGTYYKQTGADVNHRGGHPGFVRITSDNELFWPDYRGNGMFQSFGNLQVDERAGLAFVDFESGHLLQLSGSAKVEWDFEKTPDIEGATERIVRFRIDEVRRSKGPVTNYRWETLEYSPYNPIIPDKNSGLQEEGDFPMEVELVKIVEESTNVKTFRFLAPKYISFLPGQYASFDFGEMPEVNADSGNIVRTWTLSETANSTKGDVTLEISVKRKRGGVMSNWLHDHAKIGLKVKLLGIGGEMSPFIGSELPEKLLFISGGIGITPNMAILRGIGARSQESNGNIPDIVFVHQERHKDQIPFASELVRRAMVSRGKTRLMALISGELDDSDEILEGAVQISQGRINLDFLRDRVPCLKEREVYLCGPTAFMEYVSELLVELGVSVDQIVTEQFNF